MRIYLYVAAGLLALTCLYTCSMSMNSVKLQNTSAGLQSLQPALDQIANQWSTVRQANSYLVWEVAGNSGKNEANIQINELASKNYQYFQIIPIDSTYCKLQVQSTGKVIIVDGKKGENVYQQQLNKDTDKQPFKVIPVGEGLYKMQNKKYGCYLRVENDKDTVAGTKMTCQKEGSSSTFIVIPV